LLDQRFAGMKQALQGATDEDRRAAIQEMLATSTTCWTSSAWSGEDTQQDFDEFMDKHGEHFPENPRNSTS
jgi:uncharacterized protein with von Willebrand factor type A (vWA) domain